MEKTANIACQGKAHAGGFGEGLHRGQLDGINRMEMGEQILHPLRTHPRNVGKARPFHAFSTLLAMKADGKTVGFIAKSAQQGHTQLVLIRVERMAFPRKKNFLPLFGQGADVEIFVEIKLS